MLLRRITESSARGRADGHPLSFGLPIWNFFSSDLSGGLSLSKSM